MKFQDDISFRNIIVAKFQGPKFRKRAITQLISYVFFLQFFIQSAVVYLLLCGFCMKRFPLPLGAWDGLRYFIVALPAPSI